MAFLGNWSRIRNWVSIEWADCILGEFNVSVAIAIRCFLVSFSHNLVFKSLLSAIACAAYGNYTFNRPFPYELFIHNSHSIFNWLCFCCVFILSRVGSGSFLFFASFASLSVYILFILRRFSHSAMSLLSLAPDGIFLLHDFLNFSNGATYITPIQLYRLVSGCDDDHDDVFRSLLYLSLCFQIQLKEFQNAKKKKNQRSFVFIIFFIHSISWVNERFNEWS